MVVDLIPFLLLVVYTRVFLVKELADSLHEELLRISC